MRVVNGTITTNEKAAQLPEPLPTLTMQQNEYRMNTTTLRQKLLWRVANHCGWGASGVLRIINRTPHRSGLSYVEFPASFCHVPGIPTQPAQKGAGQSVSQRISGVMLRTGPD
jgi:hypothetical protein